MSKAGRAGGWIGLLVLLALFLFDFHSDVRNRDSFSWMDPSQYYSFAGSLLEGNLPEGGFVVPSLFPFFVLGSMQVKHSVPAALWVNVFFLVVLVISFVLLSRSLEIAVHPVFLLAAVVFSPLLVGLSRELYVEYALTAMMALQFHLWFRSNNFSDGKIVVLVALLFAVGLLTKMTYPLFLAGPFLVETVFFLKSREYKRFFRMAGALLVPGIAVLLVFQLFFEQSFSYYLSLGNTRIPIMRLIGPPSLLSFESITYYPGQMGRSVLVWVAPFLAIPAILAIAPGRGRRALLSRNALVLWAWLLAPMAILTLQLVKEPRHIAPCVLPAVLLIGIGIDRIRSTRVRCGAALLLLALSLLQYGAVTTHSMEVPYYLDAPTGLGGVEREMIALSPERARFTSPSGTFALLPWRYTRSIAITGFEPNQALALAWFFCPAVVYDLDIPQWEARAGTDRAYRRFEDLFYFTGFNIYNRRCNWKSYYSTLSREEVVSHADYILVKGVSEEEAVRRYPTHLHVREVPVQDGGIVRLLVPEEESEISYRTLYAREFLRIGDQLDRRELNTIYYSLFMEGRIRGRIPGREALLRGFPAGFKPGLERRNIHWIGSYGPLKDIVEGSFLEHIRG